MFHSASYLGREYGTGIRRYELNRRQWQRIAPLLPGKVGDAAHGGTNARLFVNGCMWILRSGADWRDLPERYGSWETVRRRFNRWCHAGVWEHVFEVLIADQDNEYLMFDLDIVRAHQQAKNAEEGTKTGCRGVPVRLR